MTIVPRAALFPLFIILILDSFSSVDHRLSLTLFVQQISSNIDQHSEFSPLRAHSSSFSCLCLNRSKYKSSRSHCTIIVVVFPRAFPCSIQCDGRAIYADGSTWN